MAHVHDLLTSYGGFLIQFVKNLAFVHEGRPNTHETRARTIRFGATPGAI
jgi:hypothetical protein